MSDTFKHSGIELYHGDCYEYIDSIPRDFALIADPEYGGGYQVNRKRSQMAALTWGKKGGTNHEIEWIGCADNRAFDPSPFLQFRQVILWGANHYAGELPDASCWLVWDKKKNKSPDSFSDCELAYTNLSGPVRMYSHLWRGIVREGEENVSRQRKLHPWQKPMALMSWCVAMTTGPVFDPFAGSGTVGLACLRAGRHYIGIEKEGKYYDVACERILKEIEGIR